jgi:hypothetical protein
MKNEEIRKILESENKKIYGFEGIIERSKEVLK